MATIKLNQNGQWKILADDSNVVKHSPQDLTSVQQSQARNNIGVFTQPTQPISANEGDIWFDTSKGVADYIIEQGTSGIWTYRKWNSGIAECWGNETGISMNINTAYGNVYHGGRRSSPSFPFTINNPVPSVNVTGGGGTDFVGNVAYENDKILYYWINPTSYSFSNGKAQYYVIGTWK